MKKIFMLFLVLVFVSACGGSGRGEKEIGDVVDKDSLIASLELQGSKNVKSSGTVDQPFFSVRGDIIEIGNNSIQVFEYPSDADRTADSDLISPDGTSIGTTMVTWIEPPHFWVSGKLIVLYIGSDSVMINLLTDVIGPSITE